MTFALISFKISSALLVNLRQARRPNPWSKPVNPCSSSDLHPLLVYSLKTHSRNTHGVLIFLLLLEVSPKSRRQQTSDTTKVPLVFSPIATRLSTASTRIQQNKAKQLRAVILSQERGWGEAGGEQTALRKLGNHLVLADGLLWLWFLQHLCILSVSRWNQPPEIDLTS